MNRRNLSRREQKPRLPLVSELLEARTLLTSPEFVSVGPNADTFLQDGDVLNQVPQQLMFQFTPGQVIDANTLDAVQIYAAGADNQFRPASALTDFGTGGSVLMRVGTRRLGTAENTLPLTITTAATGLGVEVTGSPATNEIQEISLPGTFTGGTFTITFNAETTAALSSTATAAQVRVALENLASVNPGDIITNGGPLGTAPISVEFAGQFVDTDVPEMTLDSLLLQNNEVQSVTISGDPTGGSFQLGFDDPGLAITGTSTAIPYNADAATVEAAITGGIPALAGMISVTGGNLPGVPILIEFVGGAADTDVALFTPASNSLTGGTTPQITVAVEQDGNLDAAVQTHAEGTTGFLNLALDSDTPTTAQDLVDLVNNDAAIGQLLFVELLEGDASASILGANQNLTLTGAGAAAAYSDFETGTSLQVLFTAVNAGLAGNDIEVQVNKLDLGSGSAAPRVSAVGNRIHVVLNENGSATTTAADLVTAINGNPDASALITASVALGAGTATVDSIADGTLIRFSGADADVSAGYRAIGDSTNDVDFRFGDQLDDDLYLVQISGTGHIRLANTTGEAVGGMQDQFQTFRLDLGGEVLSVVPQPVLREKTFTINAGTGGNPTDLADGDTFTVDPGASVFAREMSDLGTAGAGGGGITASFESVAPGVVGNGVTVDITTMDLGMGSRVPTITVSGRSVTIELNDNAGNETRAQDLFDAITADAQARSLISVLLTGDAQSIISGTHNLVLDNGLDLLTFEIDDDATVRSGNIPVAVSLTVDDETAVATALATAIGNAITTAQAANPDVPTVTASASGGVVTVTGDSFDVRLNAALADATAASSGADGLVQRADRVIVYFNDVDLDDSDVLNPRFYQLINTAGTADVTDDVMLIPSSVTYDRASRSAVLDFGSDLPTATWRLQVGTSDESGDTLTSALKLGTLFTGSGFQTSGFIGDSGTGAADADLYRFSLAATGNVTVDVNPSAALDGEIEILDEMGASVAGPASSGAGAGLADTLTAMSLAAGTYFVRVTSSGGASTGSYNLAISTTAASPITTDDNSSYATATDIGILGASGVLLSSSIDPQGFFAIPQLPNDAYPGHRDIPAESHGGGFGTGTQSNVSSAIYTYNFRDIYGTLFGIPQQNQITEGQKELARAIFEMFSRYAGIQFIETTDQGTYIATGDVRVADPTLPPSVDGISTVIIGAARAGNDESYGGNWMGVALHEIAHTLGLGHTSDLHSFQDGNGGSPTTETIASDYDINHLQAIYPYFATDIDLYRFELAEAGTVNAEILAERLTGKTRLLDATMTLFRDPYAVASSDFGGSNAAVAFTAAQAGTFGNDIRIALQKSALESGGVPTVSVTGHNITVTLDTTTPTQASQLVDAINMNALAQLLVSASLTSGNGTDDITTTATDGAVIGLGGGNREIIAANDDYYSDDPLLNIELEAGVYYLGVTAKGNESYDPTISDSGYGGLSTGDYELNISFTPAGAGSSIADADGTPTAFDGNSDGTTGDSFNFWFESGATVFVDKATAVPTGSQDGSIDAPFSTIEAGISRASTRIVVPADGTAGFRDGIYDAGDGSGFIGSDYFSINDGANPPRVFEFDVAGDGVIGSNVQIDLSGLMDPTDRGEIAMAIADAINAQTSGSFLVSATANSGGWVDLTNAGPLDLSTTPGLLTAASLLRIVGNGGTDGDVLTTDDADAYLVGINNFGVTLEDGRNFDVPQGVTAMIDHGAVLKLQSSNINVGSSNSGADRQDAALQVLGTPDNRVYFTTFRDDSLGKNTDGASSGAVPGQWGGLVFRTDSDQNDTSRGDEDANFVFLNYVNEADIRYGGGQVSVDSVVDIYRPLHLESERPTISNNIISNSAAGAISADPNSFDDSNGRIGPDIHGNTVIANSVNGLTIRTNDSSALSLEKLTEQGRFDDTDITHFILDNLLIEGNPGGWIRRNEVQELTMLGTATSGTFTLELPAGTGSTQATTMLSQDVVDPAATTIFVDSSTVFPDDDGNAVTIDYTIQIGTEILGVRDVNSNQLTVIRGLYDTTPATYIDLVNNPTTVRLARVTAPLNYNATAAEIQTALENIDGIGDGGVEVTGGPINQNKVTIEFVRQNGSDQLLELVVDNGVKSGSAGLPDGRVVVDTVVNGPLGGTEVTAREGARLRVDPGVVVKLNNQSRIEAGRGSAAIIAEGTPDNPVIFTSLMDDRYGAPSGTFDVTNNGYNTIAGNTPTYGDWGGVLLNLGTRGYFENAIFAYGGGTSVIEGGDTGGFNVIEIHEADARVANSYFEFNAAGTGGTLADRNNRETNDEATIFVRGAQPIIVNNDFSNNRGSIISIDANALKEVGVVDTGASTQPANRFDQFDANQGPLVRMNRMDVDGTPGNAVLGMEIRGGDLDTSTVWDDTDIVHVVSGQIRNNYTQHLYGGLKLVSDTGASLVVKMSAGAGFEIGNPDTDNNGTPDDGPLDIDDRIGASMQVIGQPGFPVIITALTDDEVGASLDTDGFPQTDTNANGASVGTPGYWDEILFEKYSNDTNIPVIFEAEPQLTGGVDENRTVTPTTNTAEFLGNLAATQEGGNEDNRAGFEIHGVISPDATNDVDVYSFNAFAGTEVWLDIDRTNPQLDTVLELLNANGQIIARSQDASSLTQFTAQPSSLTKLPSLGGDFYATTTREAGMRITLPGNAGESTTYFLRIRSNPGPGNVGDLDGGLTSGRYQAQIRLQQVDQSPGVSVTFADIRYATNGIHVRGLPYNSPLTGQTTENGTNDGANNTIGGAINLGNLLFSEGNSFSAAGNLTGISDVDFYRFQIDYQKIQEISGQSDGGKTWATIIDIDWADGLPRPDTTIAVFTQAGELVYIGRESNVADDRAAPGQGQDLDDLSRGSVGPLDPFIGTAMFEEASAADEFYYLAVFNNQLQPQALNANVLSGSGNTTVRLEPVNSLTRIAEDHFGFQGYTSNGTLIEPVGTLNGGTPDPAKPLVDISSAAALGSNVTSLTFDDLVLFVSQGDNLSAINPLTGATLINYGGLSGGNNLTRDIVMRSDGVLYGYQDITANGAAQQNTVGRLVTLDSGTGGVSVVGNDNILGVNPASQTGAPGIDDGTVDFDDITESNNVGALTIERSLSNGNPSYIGWYAVHENGNLGGTPTINSKLYRANVATGAVANDSGDSDFGDIQYGSVSYADGTGFISNNGVTTFYIQARAPGAAGNGIRFTLNGNTGANNANITVTASAAAGTVSVSYGRNATAQNIVNAINSDAQARQIITVTLETGDAGGRTLGDMGADSGLTILSGGVDDATFGTLRGNVTGLAFDTNTPNGGDALYGVTDAGELITIDRSHSDLRATSGFVANFTETTTGADFVQAFPDTIMRATGSWLADGFQAGDTLTVADSASNNGVNFVTIDRVTASTITLLPTDVLVDETDSVQITSSSGGVGSVRVNFVEGGAGNDTIVRTDGGSWVSDGFAGGETITITGASFFNNGTYLIDSVSATTITLDAGDDVVPQTGAGIAITSSGAGIGRTPVTFDEVPGTIADSIYRSDQGSWLADGFRMGQTINVIDTTGASGSPNNYGQFTIATVDHSTITVVETGLLTAEMGASITVQKAKLVPSDGAAIPGFTGLALGPQNLYDGVFASTIFALTTDNRLIAFEVDGSPEGARLINAFGSDNEIQTLTTSAGATGTFQLTFDHPVTGETLRSLPIDPTTATTATVQSALQNMITTGGLRPFLPTGADLNVTALDTIVRTDGGDWVTDGFTVGQEINVGGSAGNDGRFTIAAIVTTTTVNDTLRLVSTNALATVPNDTATVSSLSGDIVVTLTGQADFTDSSAAVLNGNQFEIEFTGFYTDKAVRQLGTDTAMLTGTVTIDNAINPLDPTGTLKFGGDGQRDSNVIDVAGGTGLAFSNLDFNLWHPTTLRGTDAGHGINTAFDNSRTPSDATQTVIDGASRSREHSEDQGGFSLYFGVEQFQGNGTPTYLNYDANRGQYGVADNGGRGNEFQRDLTFNGGIGNNFNLPGGAFGSTVTSAIDLSAYDFNDKPTLYFNYFLSTQDAAAAQGQNTMRDSARVFASTDGGRTFTLVATNNTILDAELPSFLSHNSTYNLSPIQELFDTGEWRQARIDLSQFAGSTTLQFRFDFSTAGSTNNEGLTGDSFGIFQGSGAAGRAQNNNFEGFYIDDIIVGFAERGELVTDAPTGSTGFDNLYLGFAGGKGDINNLMTPPTIVASGEYQLEIRRGTEYAAPADPAESDIIVYTTYDTNDRLIQDLTTTLPPITQTFDIAIDYDPYPLTFGQTGAAAWFQTDTAFASDPRSLRSGVISPGQSSGATLSQATGDGNITFMVQVDAGATGNTFEFLIDGVAQNIVIGGFDTMMTTISGTATTAPFFVPLSFPITAGSHNLEWRFTRDAMATSFGANAAFIDNLVIPQDSASTGRLGDQNVVRPQGMVVLSGNFISNVSQSGIIVEAGNRDTGGGLFNTQFPYPGAGRNTPILQANLTTGASIKNNVVSYFGNSGIRYSGDANSGSVPDAAVPMGKIINNTVYGGLSRTGTGIVVSNNASPTLINNVIANTVRPINIDSSSGGQTSRPVVQRTLLQNNGAAITGGVTFSNTVNVSTATTLFIDPANGNFYPDAGSIAVPNPIIDSSLNSVAERSPDYQAVRNPLGLPQQDFFAPDFDVYGQERVDDASTANAGIGSNIFKDLGAIERADFSGPTALLTVPLDNGPDDTNATNTEVALDNPGLLTEFVISITDPGTPPNPGVGVDDTVAGLVDGSAFVFTQTDVNGTRTLVSGIDYIYTYNANTNDAIFRAVTVFPGESAYNITVVDPSQIVDIAGNQIQPNRVDGSVQFDIVVTEGANDPPVNTVPGTQSVDENTLAVPTSLTFSAATNNLIRVDDPDAFFNGNIVQVTLTSTNGTTTLPAGFGGLITLDAGTGTDDASVQFTGTIDNINTVLDGLIFTPTLNFNGTASLNILTDDLGNFSAEPSLTPMMDDDTINIIVNPVNSVPTATSPAMVTATEDTDFDFTNTVSVSDGLDGDMGQMLVTISVDEGTLTLSQTTGLVFQNMETGSDESSMSFTGTITDINAALTGLLYHPYGAGVSPNGANQHFNGPATLTVTIDDQGNTGLGSALMDTSTTVIDVTAVNDAPQVELNGAEFMAVAGPEFDGLERTDFVFDTANSTLISVSDVDTDEDMGVDSGKLEVTLTATNGVIDLPDMALAALNVTAGADETTTITFDGLVADINAALDGMVFRPDSMFVTPDAMAGPFGTVQIDVNDGGRSGSGGLLTDSELIEINVREVNDPPVITFENVTQAEAVNEDNTLTFNMANMNRITISDSPLDPVPGAGDEFQVMLTVSQGTLTLNGVGGLDFAFAPDTDGSPAGDGTADATMTFRGNLTNINAALDGLAYTPGLDYRGADTLTITVNDRGFTGAGVALVTTDTVGISVAEVNDDPEINAPAVVQAVEDTDLTLSVSGGNGITVTDIEDDPTGTGTGLYQLTLELVDGDGALQLSSVSGLDFSFNDGNGMGVGTGTGGETLLRFRGTQADINAALNGLVYSPPAGVDGVSRTLAIELNDLGNIGLVGPDDGITTANVTIQIDGNNDAPVNVVPGTQSVAEDTGLTFSTGVGNAISVTDVDAAGGTIQVTLTATNGLLTLGNAGLVDFMFVPDAQGSPQGDGTDDASMTFRGTLGNVNMALDGLVYTPFLNFAGPAQIEITTNDLGNSGVAPNDQPLSDIDTVAINVTPVNDPPAVTTQGPLTVVEDMDVTISAANANRVAVSDVDLGSGKLLVTLSVDHGTLDLFRTTGLVFSVGDGVSDRTMTFSGGLTAVNLALDGMIYTPDAGYVGMDTLTVDLDDQGSTGAGGPMMVSQDVAITVTPANDPPVLTLPGTQTADEDTNVTFASVNGNAITVADIDVNETMGGKVELTLGVGNGTLTLGTVAGLTGDTDGSDGALQFQGTLSAVNVALSGLRYTPALNFSGTDTLDVEVSDLGNTGTGGVLTDDGSVTINVTSVNDAPVNSLQSATAMVSEDPVSPLEFTTGNSNLISVSDVDVQAAEEVQVTLSVNNGTLTLTGTSGLSFSFSDANGTGAGTGSGDSSMTFRGTLADVNAALDGLDYQPNADFSGSDTLTITSNDLGQNGSGGAKTDTDTLAITVTGQNDAPVADDDSVTVLVGSFVNGNVLANDSDVDGPTLAVVNPLVTDVMHGTLNIDFVTGAFTYTPDSMTTETSDSFQYTVTDGLLAGNTATVTIGINAAPTISGATFSIAENSGSGTAVGTLSVSDPNMDDVSLSIIAGNTGSAFAIDNDGNITVNNPSALDFESTPSFTLTVRATDDAPVPGSRDVTVTVNLTDEAEAVTIDSADFAAASGLVTVRRDGTKIRFVSTGSGLDIASAPAHEFANVTSVTFIGQDDASDTLTVDFATGNPLPAGGLSYEGGSGAGSDSLILDDGGVVTFANVTHTFTSSSSGTVDIDGQTISYTGLEPIDDYLDADARVFTFGAAADEVVISDGAAGDGLATISSTSSSETVTFDTSGSTVTVNLGGGDDSLVPTGFDSTYAGEVIVNAGDGADTVDLSTLTVDVTVNGNNGNDTITGGSGNDQLVGNSGNDVVSGGDGDDNVIGGAGRDTVSGGAGNNMVDGNGTSFDVLVENVEGNVVLTDGMLTWDTGSNTLARIEGIVIVGSSGSDSLDASAFTLFGVRLEGGDGNDTIRGTAFNDVIYADGGNDLVTAGSGNDIVFGGAGDDLLIGNAGADQLNGDDGNDRVLGGAGVDTLSGGLGNDDIDGQGATGDVLRITASGSNVTVSTSDVVHGVETDLHNRVERIEITLDDSDNEFDGGDYTGRLFVYALGGNDTILGGLGADVIFAGSGNDIVDGRAGNDIVYGGSGADALRGGTGVDRLIGHADDDTILGSEGDDFVFGGAGRDLILGEAGDDLVKGQGGRDNLAGGGNGTAASAGDVIVAGTGDTIDDAFSFDFDALLI